MISVSEATELATGPSFDSLPLSPFLQQAVQTAGYTVPTPIQAGAIPLIVEGRDVIALAQTGTGKTAAFVLPLVQKLSSTKANGVRALILAPTRELAEQINDVVRLFAGRTGLRSVTVYGGVSHRQQIMQLRNSAQIVVACPGRLMDHIRGRTIDLSGVEALILDEADRMLDMGFMPDIKAIIKELPVERQTMMFSATMPDEIAALSKSILRDPTTVRAKSEQPVAAITHAMYSLDQDAKGRALATWLRTNEQSLTVVFTKMKHTAKRIGEKLSKEGIPATSLHGNLSQAQRQRALNGFREGKFRALIATDIAARGIDVEGVTHVVNYDMPDTLEAYIHRTGRAGRASRQGDAISFVTRADRGMVRSIETWLKTPLARLTLEGVDAASTDTSESSASAEDQSDTSRSRSARGSRHSRGARPSRERGDRPTKRPMRGARQERSREGGAGEGDRQDRPRRQFRSDEGSRSGARFGGEEGRSSSRFERGATERSRGVRKPYRGSSERPGRDDRPKRGGTWRGQSFSERPNSERSESGRSSAERWRPEGFRSGESRQERSRGAGGWSRGAQARPERFRSERDGSRGFRSEQPRSERVGSERARPGRTRPDGARSDRTRTARGQPERSGRGEFRGQRDIDKNSEHVYREGQSHFIDRSEPGQRPARGQRPTRSRKSRTFSR